MKFKLFVGIALLLIILLQATLVGMLAYGGRQAQRAANSAQRTLDSKTTTFTQNTTNINNSLQKADGELQNISKELQQSPYNQALPQIP